MQHQHVFAAEEYGIFQASMQDIIRELDVAIYEANEPSDEPPLPVTQTVRRGGRGRPQVEIDETFLRSAFEVRGPSYIGDLLGVSARTVRRRALQLGLVEPQAPVFSTVEGKDGELIHLHTTSTRPVSTLTDDELMGFVVQSTELFPYVGARSIRSDLLNFGHRVPLKRVSALLNRVRGVPGDFGIRFIERRVYRVAGPNALWHHDGQHGISSRFHALNKFDVSIQGSSSMVLSYMPSLTGTPDSLLASVLITTTGLRQYSTFSLPQCKYMASLGAFEETTAQRTFELLHGWKSATGQTAGHTYGDRMYSPKPNSE